MSFSKVRSRGDIPLSVNVDSDHVKQESLEWAALLMHVHHIHVHTTNAYL